MSGFAKGFLSSFLGALCGTCAVLRWRRGKRRKQESAAETRADIATEEAWRQMQSYDAKTAYGE